MNTILLSTSKIIRRTWTNTWTVICKCTRNAIGSSIFTGLTHICTFLTLFLRIQKISWKTFSTIATRSPNTFSACRVTILALTIYSNLIVILTTCAIIRSLKTSFTIIITILACIITSFSVLVISALCETSTIR